MNTINENNGLNIEQLEERFEMTVASNNSGGSGEPGWNPMVPSDE